MIKIRAFIWIFLFICHVSARFPPLISYLSKEARVVAADQVFWHQIDNQYFNIPTYERYIYIADVITVKPMVRLDFGIYKNPFAPRTNDQVVMSVFDGTRVRPLYSNLHFTEPNIFRLTLYFCTGRILDVENVERYGGEIYDSNFPCNDANDELLKSWAHNGRQIMYSVYFDETVEDVAYVFVNINDDICEYHIKYDEIKKGSESKPHAVRFDRFKGLRLTAPPGYKVIHPFMSVDTAMRTYNYLVVNLKGPIEVKMMSYRFYSDGPKKPLRWEEYNVTNDLLPRFQYQNFHGDDGTGQAYDYHSLDFLRNYDFRVDQGNCPNNLNALMVTFDCVNFISAHYEGYEVYAMAGRSAKKMPCKKPTYSKYFGIARNLMFLERGHCKNSKVVF